MRAFDAEHQHIVEGLPAAKGRTAAKSSAEVIIATRPNYYALWQDSIQRQTLLHARS